MEPSNTPSVFEKYPDVIGVDELCEMLGGISRKLAYRILRDNRIPYIRIGREYRIAKIDVISFLFSHEKATDK